MEEITVKINIDNAMRLFQARCDKKECVDCAYGDSEDNNSCYENYKKFGGLQEDVEGLFAGMMALIYDTDAIRRRG